MRFSKHYLTLSVALGAAGNPLAVAAQSVQPTVFEETGTFATGNLDESSGVAVSRLQPGVLWTHNDSGDRALIYATNMEGADLGRFRVRGADSEDWEDIALGPCPGDTNDSPCLYIADTGDNAHERSRGIIYIVAEPAASPAPTGEEARTERAHQLRVRYPDRPENVEALAVTPSGDVLLITKGSRGLVLLFTIPAKKTHERSVNLTAADTLPIFPARRFGNLVTAAAVSPSGQRLVVRTYTHLYFFEPGREGGWRPFGAPCAIGLRQPQGEAVDFLDEFSVVLTSETALGRRAGLARAVCPLASRSG